MIREIPLMLWVADLRLFIGLIVDRFYGSQAAYES